MVEQQFLSSRNWPFGSALAMVIMAVVLIVLVTFTARTAKAGART
jgi:spermidine/putrescine transport system permease protein